VKDQLLARVSSDQEKQLVAAFFGGRKGYFVEVGANEPQLRSQTWHLEQAGWTGVLIEPQPGLADKLRAAQRSARVFALRAGTCRRPVAVACGRSAVIT
jgi:hypothetical protein